jgi:hypothetical protein
MSSDLLKADGYSASFRDVVRRKEPIPTVDTQQLSGATMECHREVNLSWGHSQDELHDPL